MAYYLEIVKIIKRKVSKDWGMAVFTKPYVATDFLKLYVKFSQKKQELSRI